MSEDRLRPSTGLAGGTDLRLGQFAPQLLDAPSHPLPLLLALVSLPLQLFIFPPQLSHSFLQLLFVALQQLEEFIRAFHRLEENARTHANTHKQACNEMKMGWKYSKKEFAVKGAV